MLIQAVGSLNFDPNDIGKTHWNRLFKGDSAKTKEQVLSEIGLGKRLAIVAARKLFAVADLVSPEHRQRDSITIRGTEDMAVQFAPCCRPIPGDPIIGQIKGGQGLVIHTHDCPAIHPYKFDPEKWIDVQWDPTIDRLFKVDIRVTVTDGRGVLAKLAAEIAATDSNISYVNMEDQMAESENRYTTVGFTLEVRHRMHLASLMRQLRHIPEVVRMSRIKSGSAKDQQRH